MLPLQKVETTSLILKLDIAATYLYEHRWSIKLPLGQYVTHQISNSQPSDPEFINNIKQEQTLSMLFYFIC